MESLSSVIFYTIDKTIKTYRQFAQKELKKAGFKITIDQWLILNAIMEDPSLSQKEISEKVFKDSASVTRIIDLLVKAAYLKRESSSKDRRRTSLHITKEGQKIICKIHEIVLKNRETALKNVSNTQLRSMKISLQNIIHNCS